MKRNAIYLLLILCTLSTSLFAQTSNIVTGTVTDKNGEPLHGVNVNSEGDSDNGTVTDAEGVYALKVESLPVVVNFGFPGFVKAQQEFTKKMVTKKIVLKNVFEYVAYGEQIKDNVTSSVYSISGEDLVSDRSTHLLIALQGRLPGLNIIQNDGEPGRESFSANVRGFDSPNKNDVLYIIDGVERDPRGIDPFEVERVTVLKDGAATAMYGMRGSGGVLLITTKTGFEGKTKINISLNHALQTPTRTPNITSAYDYANMYNSRLANDTVYEDVQNIAEGGSGIDHSGRSFYTPYELERYQKADMTEFYPVRNMSDDFLKEFANATRLNVNFQGGTEMMRYFTSVGYQNQKGIFESVPFDKYSYDSESRSNRINFRTNLDISINETLDVWTYIGGYMDKINGPRISNNGGWDYVIAKLYETPNNAHNDLTPDGEVLINRDKTNFRNTESVYGYLNRTGSSSETITRLGNTFGARQKLNKITKGLSLTAQVAFDIFSSSTQTRTRTYESWEVVTVPDMNGADSLGYASAAGTNSTLSDGQGKFFNYMYNMRGGLEYGRVFNGKHDLSGMLIAERHTLQNQDNLSSHYVGLNGRLAYAFDSRYLLETNFAYQGSEQFAQDKRYGFFPSVAAGWVISNENFLQDSKAIDLLKIRASYAQTGNNVYNYGGNNGWMYISTWNTDATEDQIGNLDIQWEPIHKYNVGLEARFLQSITLGADIYSHVNDGAVVSNIGIIPDGMMALPASKRPPGNVGEMTNQGFEVFLGYDKQVSEDFSFRLNGNISVNKNKRGFMAEMPYDDSFAYPYRMQGYAQGQHFGYETDGLFNSEEEIAEWADQTALGGTPIPGDIKYKDITGDNIVDQKDIAPLATGIAPQVTYGIRLQAQYKGFDLNAFFNGAAKRNVYLNGFGRWSNRDNFTESMKEAWTPEKAASGATISYPRLASAGNSTNYIKSDYWIKDGSYLRLRNLEVGYTLPESFTKKIKTGDIRFYVNGLNLFVWDSLPNEDFDPEMTNTLSYPILKAYNFGVTMQF